MTRTRIEQNRDLGPALSGKRCTGAAKDWPALQSILALALFLSVPGGAQAQSSPLDDPYLGSYEVEPERYDDELLFYTTAPNGTGLLGTAFDADDGPRLYRNLMQPTHQHLIAGRLMGNALEQMVLARSPSAFGGASLSVYSGFNPGQRQFYQIDNLISAGSYSDVEFQIADLDQFDEAETGCALVEEQTYHDEVVVAALNSNTNRIEVSVLAFEGVGREYIDNGALSPVIGQAGSSRIASIETLGTASTGRFSMTLGDLRSINNTGDDSIPDGAREIYISYIDQNDRLVIEGFEYQRTVARQDQTNTGSISSRQCDPGNDSRSLARVIMSLNDFPNEIRILTSPGQVEGDFAILATGGAFLGVEASPSQPYNGVLYVLHRRANGGLRQLMFESEADGPQFFAQFASNNVSLGETPAGEALEVLEASDIQLASVASPISSNGEACLGGGVVVLADTQRGPIAEVLLQRNRDLESPLPTWPSSAELSSRPITSNISASRLAAGGAYLRDRYALPALPNCASISAASFNSAPVRYQGTISHFFVTGREASGQAFIDEVRLSLNGLETLSDSIRHRPLRAARGDGRLDTDFIGIDMDIDGDGETFTATDGALVIRFLAGFRGTALIEGLGIASSAIPEIEALLTAAALSGKLDVDGDGVATALGDGVMRARALDPGFDATEIANQSVSENCQRCTPQQIEAYLRPPTSSLGPVLAVLADTDGDAAYESIGLGNGQRTWIARGIGFEILNFKTSEVVLATPPQHIDYLNGQVRNVSLGDSIRSSYRRVNAQATSNAIQRDRRSSWTASRSTTRSASVSAGVGPISASLSGSETTSFQQERNSKFSERDSQVQTLSTNDAIVAQSGDLLLTSTRDFDLWRYPAMGLGNAASNPVDFLEFVVPRESQTEGALEVQNGNTLDEYQVRHIPGNLLSYPARINDFILPNEQVRPWNPNAGFNPCSPNQAPTVCDLQESQPGVLLDRAAEINGDGSVSSTLSFGEAITQSTAAGQSTRLTSSRERTVKAEVGAKGAFKMFTGGASASFEQSFSETDSETYEDLRTVQLRVQRDQEISVEFGEAENNNASYTVQSLVHFNEQGALQLSFGVGLPNTGQVQFWSDNYSAPDPGFGKPFMFCSGTLECQDRINSSSNRHQIRGVAVRNATGIDARRADAATGSLITTVPNAGERLQIQVRVYNFSVATPATDVSVRFYAQELNTDNSPLGQPFLIGEDVIDEIPYRGQFGDAQPNGHMRDAWVIWETQGLGSDNGNLKRFDILAIIDPEDTIPGETHELVDRFNDPLLVDGSPIDPVPFGAPGTFMQKASNNYGETRIALAPEPDDFFRAAPFREPVQVSLLTPVVKTESDRSGQTGVALAFDIQSDRLDRSIRQLHVQAIDLQGRIHPIATPTIHGLNPGLNTVELQWSPPSSGEYVVQARLSHALADGGRPAPILRTSISVN
jgi:hypothetical protein